MIYLLAVSHCTCMSYEPSTWLMSGNHMQGPTAFPNKPRLPRFHSFHSLQTYLNSTYNITFTYTRYLPCHAATNRIVQLQCRHRTPLSQTALHHSSPHLEPLHDCPFPIDGRQHVGCDLITAFGLRSVKLFFPVDLDINSQDTPCH